MVKLFFSLTEEREGLIFFIFGLPFLSVMLMTPFLYKFVVRLLYLNINVLSACVGAGGNVMKSKSEFLDKQIKIIRDFSRVQVADLMTHPLKRWQHFKVTVILFPLNWTF